MCGICGVVDFSGAQIDSGVVDRMRDALAHRGPDDALSIVLPHVGLGFRRLSIIDLAGGRQPMSNENDRVWLAFNGEIYNFQTLREELLAKGHRFKSRGDSETILHLYEDYGLDFVQHLNGMFAIALWDIERERLVLARDRFGVKPLYLAFRGQRLLFSSEIKGLLASGEVKGEPDPHAIVAFMNFSSVPGRRTGFGSIERLLPGHVAVFDRAGFHMSRYWELSYNRQRLWRPAEAEAAVEELVHDSVRLRMVSDVPLGVFLSGGVDSGLVAAMMANESSQPVEAFAVGYGREGAFMNETQYAGQIAERYGMKFRSLVLDEEDLLRDVERVVWHLDEPCGDPSAFLTFALSEFTRRHVTVALSGLGGDELFAGYRRYLAMRWHERYTRIPELLRRRVISRMVSWFPEGRTRRWEYTVGLARKFATALETDDPGVAWKNLVSYLPNYDGAIFGGAFSDVRAATYRSDEVASLWEAAGDVADPVDRAMYVDAQTYLPNQLLLLQDKMSMAVGLEAREPLLDFRLAELAASFPAKTKIKGNKLKVILKKVAERYLPRECIYRPKQGFSPPLAPWLRGILRERVYDILSARRVRDRGVFDPAFVEWLKREFFERGRELSIPVYQVFLLEIWFRLFVDGGGRTFGPTMLSDRNADSNAVSVGSSQKDALTDNVAC